MKKAAFIVFLYALILAVIAAVYTIMNTVLYMCFTLANMFSLGSVLAATTGKAICVSAMAALFFVFLGLLYAMLGIGGAAFTGMAAKSVIGQMAKPWKSIPHVAKGTGQIMGRTTGFIWGSAAKGTKGLRDTFGIDGMKKMASDITKADSSDLIKGAYLSRVIGANNTAKYLGKAAGVKHAQEVIFGGRNEEEDAQANTGEKEREEDEKEVIPSSKEQKGSSRKFSKPSTWRKKRRSQEEELDDVEVFAPRTKTNEDTDKEEIPEETEIKPHTDDEIKQKYNDNHKEQHEAEQEEGIEDTSEPTLQINNVFNNSFTVGDGSAVGPTGLPIREYYDENGNLKEEFRSTTDLPEKFKDAQLGVNHSQHERTLANVDAQKGERIVTENPEGTPETDKEVADQSARERSEKANKASLYAPGVPEGTSPKDANEVREQMALNRQMWILEDGSTAQDSLDAVVRTGELLARGEEVYGTTLPSSALINEENRMEENLNDMTYSAYQQYVDGLDESNINKATSQEELQELQKKRDNFLADITDQNGNHVGDQIREVVGEEGFEESMQYPVLIANADGGFTAVTDENGNVIFQDATEKTPRIEDLTDEQAASNMVGGAISTNDETNATQQPEEEVKEQPDKEESAPQHKASDFTAGNSGSAEREPERETVSRVSTKQQENNKTMDAQQQSPDENEVQNGRKANHDDIETDSDNNANESASIRQPERNTSKNINEQQAQTASNMIQSAQEPSGSERNYKFESSLFRFIETLNIPGMYVAGNDRRNDSSTQNVNSNNSSSGVNIRDVTIHNLEMALSQANPDDPNYYAKLDQANRQLMKELLGDKATDTQVNDYTKVINRAINAEFKAQKEKDEEEARISRNNIDDEGNDGTAKKTNNKKNVKMKGRTARIDNDADIIDDE